METFVMKKSFNPELEGTAVRFKGFNEDGEQPNGIWLVKRSEGDELTVINSDGIPKYLDINDFTHEENPLQLIILEEPK